jgi:hypothetical protein
VQYTEIAMTLSLKVCLNPDLLDGEHILHVVPSVGFVSCKALPTYRLFFPVPLLCKAALYVTDRRTLVVTRMFGLVVQQFGSWYPGREPQGDGELVVSASVGRMRVLGPYLEVVSSNERRPYCPRWLCARDVRMRFFMREPEPLCDAVREHLEDRRAGRRN